MESKEQQLIDICFEIGLTVARHEIFRTKTDEEIADWIRDQLKKCGFNVVPMGMSWGYLVD